MRYRDALAAVGAVSLLSAPAAAQDGTGVVRFYREASVFELLALELGPLLILGALVLGLFPGWGTATVRTARRHTVPSLATGAIGSLALLGLAAAGGFFSVLLLTTVASVPILVAVVSFSLVCRSVGFIAVGAVLASRAGTDNLWIGLLVGALTNAVALVVPFAGPITNVAVLILGVGAGLRVTLGTGAGGATDPAAPPASRS